MQLTTLTGTLTHYQGTQGYGNFVFTEGSQKAMGAIAIAAGAAGLSGPAVNTAVAADSLEEEASYLEFELEGKLIKGWLWRNPFKEGDEVIAVVEQQENHYELYALARPKDQMIALYPHCARGSYAHWCNIWKWWLWLTGGLLLISMIVMEIASWIFFLNRFFWMSENGRIQCQSCQLQFSYWQLRSPGPTVI